MDQVSAAVGIRPFAMEQASIILLIVTAADPTFLSCPQASEATHVPHLAEDLNSQLEETKLPAVKSLNVPPSLSTPLNVLEFLPAALKEEVSLSQPGLSLSPTL